MPCNTITTQSIKLANAIPELVKKALQELDWNITGETKTRIIARRSSDTVIWEQGKGLTIQGMNTGRTQLDAITQAYSKQAVSWAAQRAGWQVKSNNQNQLNLTRR